MIKQLFKLNKNLMQIISHFFFKNLFYCKSKLNKFLQEKIIYIINNNQDFLHQEHP